MSIAGAIAYGFAAYAAAGAVTALAFVCFGISRVLPQPMPATLGARILFIPGSVALWPYILIQGRNLQSAGRFSLVPPTPIWHNSL